MPQCSQTNRPPLASSIVLGEVRTLTLLGILAWFVRQLLPGDIASPADPLRNTEYIGRERSTEPKPINLPGQFSQNVSSENHCRQTKNVHGGQ